MESKVTIQRINLNQLWLVILFAVVSIIPAKSFAYTPEEGNVSAILGPFLYKTNFGHANVGFDSPERLGVGLIALGDLNKNGALEIGIFTLTKVYTREVATRYIAQSAELLHITMGYRYYISQRFSTSLTFFSAYALGTPETIYSQFAPTVNIDTSAKDNTEYGFDLAGQMEIVSHKRIGLVLEGRYSLNLTPKEQEHADHFGALLGLRYLISSPKPMK